LRGPDRRTGRSAQWIAGLTPIKPQPLAALAYRDFRLLFAAQPLMLVGSGMRNVANAYQVYQLTGDARLLGLTFLFQGIPILVMGLIGGSLADIFDRRRLLQVVVAVEAALALLLAFLTASGHIAVWHIYAVTFAAALLDSVTHPAQQALIPKLVPEKDLLNATALRSSTNQAAQLAGPLLGGFAIQVLGTAQVYASNAAVLVPALVMLSLLHVREDGNRVRPPLNLAFVLDGLRFVLRTPALLAFTMLDTVTMVLGFYPAMMPVFAKDVLQEGAAGLGALLAAPAFGAMLGFIGVLLLGSVRRRGLVILNVTIAHAVVLLLFSQSTWFPLALVLVALLGFLDSLSVTVRMTAFQTLAPDHVRGRVMSVLVITAVSSNSLGGAFLGFTTEWLGVREALAAGAIGAGAFAVLVAVFWKQVRRF
jgi:MFS family permease